ncbi:MAG: carboxypeptidase-like regulatory domain-containing protein [Paludibacteraceae bacterium]
MSKFSAKIGFTLFLTVLSHTLLSQTRTITGKVTDENNNSLSGAHVFLAKSGKSTITNGDGSFSLKTTNTDDTLSVSNIGYETFSTRINFQNNRLLIKLQPAVIQLNEVIVTNLTAEEILNKAIGKIPDNYPQDEFLAKMFYRAKIYESDDSLVYVEETAFNQVKSYSPNFQDKTFLERNRYFNFNEGAKFGIKGIGGFDYVKIYLERGIFSKKDKYDFAPFSKWDGRTVYVIAINNDSEKKNITTGKIYIDTDDLAFVRFDLRKDDKHHTVQYKKIDGKYYLVNSTAYNTNPRLNGGYSEVTSQMTLTNILTTFRPEDVKGIFVKNEDLLRAYATQMTDTVFWRNHNTILPDSLTQKKITDFISLSQMSQSKHVDKANALENTARLYAPNITLKASSQFPSDLNTLSQNATSVNSLLNYFSRKNIKNQYLGLLGAVFVNDFLLLPLEQAEAQRKLLSLNNLKTKSNPTAFNALETGYRYGLSTEQINAFKTENYTDFMRLHTIVDEYSYLKSKQIEEQVVKVDMHDRNNKYDYLFYFFSDLVYNRLLGIDFTPNTNVNYKKDINSDRAPLIIDRRKSWVKYLFEPNADFTRQVTKKELHPLETQFLKRSASLSLLNLVSPQMFMLGKFSIADNLKFTFSTSYLRTPFGEQIEENLWFSYQNILNGLFIRQYLNHEKTGWGVGYKLYDLKLHKDVNLTSTLDYWLQPENLRFFDKNLKSGVHVGQELEWKLLRDKYTRLNKIAIYVGCDYKTKGYLPDNLSVNNNFKITGGMRINF